jgi:hypothetical protein
MDNLDLFIRPPEKVDIPYADLMSGAFWDFTPREGEPWPAARFCSDDECVALSGVPLPSLLTLQTAEAIHVTRAPVGGGTHRRVWHVSHVAAASMIDALRKATGLNYRTAGIFTFHASLYTRIAFFNFLKLREASALDQFHADLIFMNGTMFLMRVSPTLQVLDSTFRTPDGSDTFPIAGVQDGNSAGFDPANAKLRSKIMDAFGRARFSVTINLKNVFLDLETKARALRRE